MSAVDERTTTPALLVEGDSILDTRGRVCVVDRVDAVHLGEGTPHTVHLRIGDKVHAVPLDKMPAQVTLVQTAAEAHERALALAQVRLGGEVVMVKAPDGPHHVPARFPDLASLLGHLYLAHQREGRDPKMPAEFPTGNYGDAVRWHDEQHTRTLLVPHVHDEAFYRRVDRDDDSA